MVRNLLISCLVFLGLLGSLSAQSLKNYEKAADKAMLRRDYFAAMEYYATVLERKQDKTELWWKYGEASRFYNSFEQAEKAYEHVIEKDPDGEAYPMALLRLAQVRQQQGQYEEAAALFGQLAERDTTELGKEAMVAFEDVNWALEQLDRDSVPEIKHPGKSINSEYSDFAPVVLGDTLYFSSYRFNKKGTRQKPTPKTTRLMRALPGSRARPPGRGFPDADSVHVAHTAFYEEGIFLIFNQCKETENGSIRCDLWLTVLDRRNRWLKPMRLPEPVNLPGYTSTQPSIGFDSSLNAPVLWFASDRPGGKGGLDIWSVPLDTLWFCTCNRPLDGRKGTYMPLFEVAPSPVEQLNTAGDDGTPFFHEHSETMYFSSNGRRGFGGFDIYASSLSADGNWSEPVNMGPGVNTSYNDLYYFLNPDGFSGYLSSNRPGAFYLDKKNKSCCNDLFEVIWPRPEPVPADDGTPEKPDTLSAPILPPTIATVPAKDSIPTVQELKETFIGLPLYFDNDHPDPRTRKTVTRKNYEETVLVYLDKQETYREAFSKGLTGDKKDQAVNAIDNFFDEDVRRGYERLSEFAGLLLSSLNNGDRVEVLIKGFTSPLAKNDYNLRLGSRRVSSVINFFKAYEDGALEKYIKDGSLRIEETSFGESTADKSVSDEWTDLRNSVYHPAAARERRVEIVSIRELD